MKIRNKTPPQQNGKRTRGIFPLNAPLPGRPRGDVIRPYSSDMGLSPLAGANQDIITEYDEITTSWLGATQGDRATRNIAAGTDADFVITAWNLVVFNSATGAIEENAPILLTVKDASNNYEFFKGVMPQAIIVSRSNATIPPISFSLSRRSDLPHFYRLFRNSALVVTFEFVDFPNANTFDVYFGACGFKEFRR